MGGPTHPEPAPCQSRRGVDTAHAMQRKLTVIFSADVVGYSALMERDEAGTLRRLQENRKALFDPCVALHGGRIFKLMGDGVLIEFASAASAVTCAIEIQQAMETAEPNVPHSERLAYRIGINLGDVIDVKVLDIDRTGKMKLSRKALLSRDS